MLKAIDIMTPDPVTLSPETDIRSAVALLIEKKINGAPVVDAKGKLVGVLCQSDLVAQHKQVTMPSLFSMLDGFIALSSREDFEREIRKIAASTVADAMTPHAKSVSPHTPIDEIATVMVNEKLYTLPVVDGGKLVGVVGKEDILRTLLEHHDAKA
ncbi:CBS domain-containing protein [Humidesulfovibrio mexicanus]|jgi:CBS-domain-containing membrane protein|uniref:CBS domain-containing protein n=1 Tax=Humidesulfovibrio mexicanus TaxID=147047 RepID=A0A238Z7Z6_9BACT|nr:CBS domain-containing protein [Humidesulfovibrio mexicanus]SNR79108.1 CBS domain-containing protein [Humidesulfovibrio mexicanus]